MFEQKIRAFSDYVKIMQKDIEENNDLKKSIVLSFLLIFGYERYVYEKDYSDDDVYIDSEFSWYISSFYSKDPFAFENDKVDYAILRENHMEYIVVVVKIISHFSEGECDLPELFNKQTLPKIGITTDGIRYKFYTDFYSYDNWDDEPFFEFNLLDFDDQDIKYLKNFEKESFNVENILNSVPRKDMMYVPLIKPLIKEKLKNPSDELVKEIIKDVPNINLTQETIDFFKPVIRNAYFGNNRDAFMMSEIIKANDLLRYTEMKRHG